VQVDVEDGIPGVEEAQHRLHLRRGRLHVVAIEVQVLRRDAPAHLLRTHLIRAIPAAHALVAVHVENRHEDERNLLQNPWGDLVLEHLAQREETRILAVDLACVNAALDENDGQVVRGGICRRQARCARGDQRQHGPPLRSAPEFEAAHRLRPLRRVGRAQLLDLLVAAGACEAGALGNRCQGMHGLCGSDRAYATADRSEARRGE
jgi:hypothetical protein